MKRDPTTKAANQRRLKLLQRLLIVIGGSVILIALSADRLGYGQPGGFGIGQFLLVLVGLVLILVGLLGKRFLQLYRGVAIILLNTLVLLAILELGAIITSRTFRQVENTEIQDLPYYGSQDWTKDYWLEAVLAESYHYESYVVWRHHPFNGQTVNIDKEGIRQTPGAECTASAYKVFTFGGSTMWGWGSPDWGTIAAHLQADLESRMVQAVCVTNFGEDGYVSTQSVIELIKQLQLDNVPDAVIFYDGVNDVYAAYESGQAGAHISLGNISAKFEESEHPLLKWFKSSRQYSLYESLVAKLKPGRALADQNFNTYMDRGVDVDQLATSVTKTYLGNYRIVGALANAHGFEYYFFWQPHIGIDEKPLTKHEQAILKALDPDLVVLVQAVYDMINSSSPDYENLWYLANVFQDQTEQIWIDALGHVTPEGNRLVAHEMMLRIDSQLVETR